MRGSLEVFRYQEGDTPLHRLDPRAKLAIALALLLFLWMRTDLLIPLAATVPVLLLVALGRLWRPMAGSLRLYGFLGLLLLPGNALLYSLYAGDGATPLLLLALPEPLPAASLLLTREALALSALVYLRLVLVLAIASVFVMTTDLDEIEALLYRLRFPSFVVLTLTFAFRFLPVLGEEVERIRMAQRARGLETRQGGPLRRWWNAVVPLFFPLVVGVLRRALRLAEALETRGTFVHPRRTVMADLTFRRQDAAVTASTAVALGASFLLLVLWPVV